MPALSPSGIKGHAPALIEVALDKSGELLAIRTRTLQASALWLLQELCTHAARGDRASTAAAVAAFTGGEVEASAEPHEWAEGCYAMLQQEMVKWQAIASLDARHPKVMQRLEDVGADIATLVEFNEEWRRRGLPPGFCMVAGLGQAAIAYRTNTFERIESVPGVSLPVCCSLPFQLC